MVFILDELGFRARSEVVFVDMVPCAQVTFYSPKLPLPAHAPYLRPCRHKSNQNGVFVAIFTISTDFARNWQRGIFLHHHARKMAQWWLWDSANSSSIAWPWLLILPAQNVLGDRILVVAHGIRQSVWAGSDSETVRIKYLTTPLITKSKLNRGRPQIPFARAHN